MAWDRTKASDPAHIGPEGLAGRPVAAGSMLHPNRGRRAVKRAAARTDFLVRAQSGDSHQAVGSPETPSSGDGPSADPMSGPEAFSAAFPTRTNLRSTGGPATVVVPSKSDFQTRRARPRRNCGHPSRPQNQFTISPLQHVHQAAPRSRNQTGGLQRQTTPHAHPHSGRIDPRQEFRTRIRAPHPAETRTTMVP